ncbi:MAG: hypothetical protein HOV66_25785 [Streptomycetaceae bacterium]|jgi:uncharacterized protein YjbJ (UPF0337 family)|nr:hypothetical protein [Streptomycetaceae bacterium]
MSAKTAKDELTGTIKELIGRLTGNRQQRHHGRTAKDEAKAQGLAEAADTTDSPRPRRLRRR